MGLNDVRLQLWALPVGTGSQLAVGPALPQGVHLRWACLRELGMPWGGFYVLRRASDGLDPSGTMPAELDSPPNPWQLATDLTQPIALPVYSPDYPAAKVIPILAGQTAGSASAAFGLSRVHAADKQGLTDGFSPLFEYLLKLVVGGPLSEPMCDREVSLPPAKDTDSLAPQLATQSTLDLVLLGVAYPEFAQLLGLYAIDTATYGGLAFDYLVVADFDVTFACEPAAVLTWANSGCADLAGVSARLVANVATAPSGILPPPYAVAAYQLPITTLPVDGKPGQIKPYFAAAGLVWQCDPMPGVFGDDPPRPNLFRVARATHPVPAAKPNQIAGVDLPVLWKPFAPLGEPGVWHLAAGERLQVEVDTATPLDWPQSQIQYLDPNLGEGWHLWRVQAMDWFGRWSAPSAVAQWWHWTPPLTDAGQPLGGFAKFMANYCGQGDMLVHPTAMLVLDKTPPPSPVGLDVTALDPADPWHFDPLWCAANVAQIGTSNFGARLRWSWPWAAQRQAPDLAEFRVYLRTGASNTLAAKVVPTVAAVDKSYAPHLVTIAVTLPPAATVADLVGATIRFEKTAAAIVHAQGEPPQAVVIAPLPAPHSMLDLAVGEACTVVLPSGHKLWRPPTDVAQPGWQRRLVVPASQGKSVFEVYRDDQGQPYVLPVVAVTPKGFQLGGEAPLEAVFTGLWQLLAVGIGPNGVPDLKGAKPFGIVDVDLAAREIHTDAPPPGPGLPKGELRAYLGQASLAFECYLPVDSVVPMPPADVGKLQFEVAVSAADDKAHADDWLTQGLNSQRPGNESEVAGPRRAERVRRVPADAMPKVAAAWGDLDKKASPADVDGFSYVTLRWNAGPTAVLLSRASELGVFRADWQARQGIVNDELMTLFGGSFAKAMAGHYEKLDGKAVRALADKTVVAFSPVTASPLLAGQCPDVVGPDAPVGYKVQAGLRAFVDRLDGLVGGRWFYRVVEVDAAGNVGAAGSAGVSPAVVVEVPVVVPAPVILRAYAGTPEFAKSVVGKAAAQIGGFPTDAKDRLTMEFGLPAVGVVDAIGICVMDFGAAAQHFNVAVPVDKVEATWVSPPLASGVHRIAVQGWKGVIASERRVLTWTTGAVGAGAV